MEFLGSFLRRHFAGKPLELKRREMRAVFSGYSFFDVARGLWSVLFYAHCTTSKYAKQVLHDRFGTPALFIFITSGIEFVSENSPIIKFDPNPASNGQFPTPESIRGMGTSFRRNDFWDRLWVLGGGGGSGGKREL